MSIAEHNARQSAFYAENDRTVDAGPDPVSTLHAHVEHNSRDCDGVIESSHVSRPNDDEEDHDFRDRMVGMTVSAHANQGTLTVTDGDLSWHENTEEGYSATDVTFCHEPDCDAPRTYRDHTAESMGY